MCSYSRTIVTTPRNGRDLFPDFLSEMLNTCIISSLCATGFLSRMPCPLTYAC